MSSDGSPAVDGSGEPPAISPGGPLEASFTRAKPCAAEGTKQDTPCVRSRAATLVKKLPRFEPLPFRVFVHSVGRQYSRRASAHFGGGALPIETSYSRATIVRVVSNARGASSGPAQISTAMCSTAERGSHPSMTNNRYDAVDARIATEGISSFDRRMRQD